MKKVLLLLVAISISFSCGTQLQIPQNLDDILNIPSGSSTPSNTEVVGGLKEALVLGTQKGVDVLSQTNGYFGNPLIKILWPDEAKKVENALRNIGLNKLCDDVILSLNRAAEDASKGAKDIFVTAIKQMTFQDAMDILFGADNAATEYLKKTTTTPLKNKFKPVIQTSLDKVNATKFWNQAMTKYNNIPLVEDVNPDLAEYVTLKALDGLFLKIQEEEKKIRENPLERVTNLLKKVFGYYDANK